MFFIEDLSNRISYKITKTLKLDKCSEEIIAYGAFNLLQILWSTLWIVLFGIVFNMLIEILIIFFIISILRKYSGGVHASSPGRCTIIGTSVCVGLAIIIHKLSWIFNLYLVIPFSVISLMSSFYIIYKRAPVDSPAKPIVKVETKKQFKKKAIILLIILFIFVFIMLIFYFRHNNYIFLLKIVLCICVGATWQCFTLTIQGDKILINIDNILKNIVRK